MELFSKRDMIYLMGELLRHTDSYHIDPEFWLNNYDYKKALKDERRRMYNVLKMEYRQKRELTKMNILQEAYYEGALCRVLHEMEEPLSFIYTIILRDSPQEMKVAYSKGFNNHFNFGHITVVYPKPEMSQNF